MKQFNIDAVDRPTINSSRTFAVAIVRAGELPKAGYEPNVRDPNARDKTSKELKGKLVGNPESFVFGNNGAKLSVRSAILTKNGLQVELAANDGYFNGGHTVEAILEELAGRRKTFATLRSNPKVSEADLRDAQVAVEQIESVEVVLHVAIGLDKQALVDATIVSNTSRTPRKHSIANAHGDFDALKKQLSPSIKDRVLWYENQQVEEEGLTANHLVKVALVLDIGFDAGGLTKFGSTFMKNFNERKDMKTLPLVEEGLYLYERIEAEIAKRMRTPQPLINGAKKQDIVQPLSGHASTWKVPASFVYVALAGLRPLVNADGTWKQDPNKFLDKKLKTLVDEFLKIYKDSGSEGGTYFVKNGNAWKAMAAVATAWV